MDFKTITINASTNYDIHVGFGIFFHVGTFVKPFNASSIVVVSDSNVFSLYGSLLIDNLSGENIQTEVFVFPAGENSKNIQTYSELLNFLAMKNITRDGLIIALGGGVVGDLAGFAASTYLRGIRYMQIPTSLLAAVDSSVGGKTGIDLPAGKNLAGSFWQPSLVLCDCSLFSSLPKEEIYNGAAEIVKYGCIKDSNLFCEISDGKTIQNLVSYDRLKPVGTKDNEISTKKEYLNRLKDTVARCLEIKQACVEADEFDNGVRALLNFGHTFVHAIEKLSNYRVSHGRAVAYGMVMAAKISVKIGFSSVNCVRPLTDALQANGLGTACTAYGAEEIAKAALSDKKRKGNQISLVLMRNIGDCDLYHTNVEKLPSLITLGLSE